MLIGSKYANTSLGVLSSSKKEACVVSETVENAEKKVLSADDLQNMGFARGMTYNLLNRKDLPVVTIGRRKFMHRDLFMAWLKAQAESNAAE